MSKIEKIVALVSAAQSDLYENALRYRDTIDWWNQHHSIEAERYKTADSSFPARIRDAMRNFPFDRDAWSLLSIRDAAQILLITVLRLSPSFEPGRIGLKEQTAWGERGFQDDGSFGRSAAGLGCFLQWDSGGRWIELAKTAWQLMRAPTWDEIAHERSTGEKSRQPPSRVTKNEANITARELLRQNPNATVRQLAKGVGCSTGLVSKLPAWKAVKEQRDIGRQPKKTVTFALTKKMELTIGVEDKQLAKLIAEQQADSEQSPLEDDAPDSRKGAPRMAKLYGRS